MSKIILKTMQKVLKKINSTELICFIGQAQKYICMVTKYQPINVKFCLVAVQKCTIVQEKCIFSWKWEPLCTAGACCAISKWSFLNKTKEKTKIVFHEICPPIYNWHHTYFTLLYIYFFQK